MRMGEQATQKISTIGTGALGLDLATDAAAIQEDVVEYGQNPVVKPL